MLRTLLLISLGGAIGSGLRYLASVVTAKYFETAFPVATLAVNVIGCLAIGILMGWFSRQYLAEDLKWFLVTGVCGGFTTFSAFGHESVKLFQGGNPGIAVGYIAASVAGGLLAVWAGLWLAR
jgi:CrcB protein